MKGRIDSNSRLFADQDMAELSHELGNVLHGLLGMAQLVRDSALTVEQDQWLGAIEQSGQQLRRLIEAFRPHRDRSVRRPDPGSSRIDGIELLEQVALSHAPAALDRGNRLLLIAGPDLPRTWRCDPCQLRQLLDNLLGNALKFTNSGDVQLEARNWRCNEDGSATLALAVTDTGPGIGAEVAGRMFGAYQQGSEGVRDAPQGHGLGLYICRRIAQALGGEIRWTTPAGGGARFEIRLPGVLVGPPVSIHPHSRLLQSVCCRLELSGPLLRAVAGCLSRLGVPWHEAARAAACGERRGADGVLQIQVSEIQTDGAHPGPLLLFQRSAEAGGPRTLLGPPLECNFGPLMFEMVLEWLWIRDGKLGSVAELRRSAPPDCPGSLQG